MMGFGGCPTYTKKTYQNNLLSTFENIANDSLERIAIVACSRKKKKKSIKTISL